MTETSRTDMVREFQRKLGREYPDGPTTEALDRDDQLRAAHARIVLEEALELVEALGCSVHVRGSREVVGRSTLTVGVDPRRDFQLIDAVHECGDVAYANETVASMLGVRDLTEVFAVLHQSNLSKILPDGTLIRHPRSSNDSRYQRPDIAGVLTRQSRQSADQDAPILGGDHPGGAHADVAEPPRGA